METFAGYMQKNWAWAVTVAMGLIALWVAKRRTQKAFSYRVLTDTPLVSKTAGAKGQIEILYEGRAVESLRLVEVELRNTGAKELEGKDFWEPVRIRFGDGTELFEPEVASSYPPGLTADVAVEGGSLVVSPKPMNAGDVIVVKVLVPSTGAIPVEVTSRIAGVPHVTVYDPTQTPAAILKADAFSLGLLALCLVYTLYTDDRFNKFMLVGVLVLWAVAFVMRSNRAQQPPTQPRKKQR